MAFVKIPNVAIRGVAACVPPKIEEVKDLPFYAEGEAADVMTTTGVERKHVVSEGMTGSDLCLKATEELLEKLGWERESIDAICYVTQTPDFTSPPTVFVMHDKLNLSEHCMAVDINHGCPGWVVGLNSLASLMSHGSIKRALLLDGDNITVTQYAMDRESRPLFGDCGTATALEYDENAAPMLFEIGTNTKDGRALMHEKGGWRTPYTMETYQEELDLRSGKKTMEAVTDAMDGMSVFSFGITMPPKSMKRLCTEYGVDINDIDKLLIHQANLFMVNKIAKKMKVEESKVPISLKNFGNTTSCTIPLTMVSQCANDYATQKQKTLACGFGTGLAWASVYFETENIVCPEVIVY